MEGNPFEEITLPPRPHFENVASYRFHIFKGRINSTGKVEKVRSMGVASLLPGSKTYHVHLRTLLKDEFFLLPANRSDATFDYAILTRTPSRRSGQKYHWTQVGEARVLGAQNMGLMELSWDLFGAPDIYMKLEPSTRIFQG